MIAHSFCFVNKNNYLLICQVQILKQSSGKKFSGNGEHSSARKINFIDSEKKYAYKCYSIILKLPTTKINLYSTNRKKH